METIKSIMIESDDMDYMQFLYFERESYQRILGFILLEKSKGYKYSKENYEHFMNEYKEAHMKYSMASLALLEVYAPEYKGKKEYNVIYDFETREMKIVSGVDDNEN